MFNPFIKRLLTCSVLLAFTCPWAVAAGTIRIDEFTVTPQELALGESFNVWACVDAADVPVVSFVLRTAEPIEPGDAPPPLSHYNGGRRLAYLPEAGQVNLSDNGELDLEPAKGAFEMGVSTKGWRAGRYPLAFFAHNRPSAGPHIVDQRNFVVTVDGTSVRIAYTEVSSGPRFVRCGFLAEAVRPGEPAMLRASCEGAEIAGIEVRHQYFVVPERVPPAFQYDAESREARLVDAGDTLVGDNGPNDADPLAGEMAVRFATAKWRPGLYHFAVTVHSKDGVAGDACDVALKVRSPEDHLAVTVSPSWPLFPGTHAERVARLDNGTLVYSSHHSTDEGRTWLSRESGTIGAGATQLRDGRVLGMAYRTLPIEDRAGWYRGERFVSEDGGISVQQLAAEFHVPEAKPAMGHAYHPGPLFMRSIVERPDSSLVALMAGWFVGDDAPCPHNPKRPYSRTYVCESVDRGATWKYVTTIGYDHLGSEGYNEGSMKALPNGDLVAVMRTGSMRDRKCQDNPIMVATSTDGGQTWTEPWRTGVNGAFPDLCVLSDDALAVSYGRPGASIMFSTDRGRTWTDHTIVDATPYSGYTTLCEIGPREILMLFGVKDRRDAKTHMRSDEIRAARIGYRPHGAPQEDAQAATAPPAP